MNDANGFSQFAVEIDQMIAPWQITLSATGACLSLILMAADASAAEDPAKQGNLARIASELALAKGQAQEVDRILVEAVERRSQVRESSGELSREQIRIALKSITENADNRLRSILSDEQFSRYVVLRSELRREALRQRFRDKQWNNHEE